MQGKFDTKVQLLKYQVLREVARSAWKNELLETIPEIPHMIIPGKTPTMRCCVYKERAILAERVKLAIGGPKGDPNVIHVIDIACEDCPAGGFTVTESCRGCLAHRCEGACPRDAIFFDEHQKAHIDKSKCINCGKCAQVCPYSAISNRKRPCENACKIKAISMAEDGSSQIDHKKCISCGACVYQCPFGAISDKSFILDTINILKGSDNGRAYPTCAIIAPSFVSQFAPNKPGQVISAIKALGFTYVAEAALGADIVAYTEAAELREKGFLTSSCCPAFVSYIQKSFPALADNISHNLSPMATIAKRLKENMPTLKNVFIGPCTAKKMEFQKESVRPYIDNVITFEELEALFDSRDLDVDSMEESKLDTASNFGRIFARSGGLAEAVAEGLKEQGLDDFELKAVSCNGIEECRTALMKASHGKADGNFIEGMACPEGCIGGAGCLRHGSGNRGIVDAYGKEALDRTMKKAIDSDNNMI